MERTAIASRAEKISQLLEQLSEELAFAIPGEDAGQENRHRHIWNHSASGAAHFSKKCAADGIFGWRHFSSATYTQLHRYGIVAMVVCYSVAYESYFWYAC